MTTVQPYLTDRFHDLRVVVIGEAMLDSYLKGDSDRLCREAPVPVVTLKDCEYQPGGAANAAVNMRSMGAQVDFISVIGEDQEGDLLCQALARHELPLDHVLRVRGRRTLAKQRVISAGQVLLRFDQGSTTVLDPATEDRVIEGLQALHPHCDALLISHYGYGILTPRVIQAIVKLQSENPRLLAVDAKQLSTYRQLGASVMKPNYEEIISLLGITKASDAAERAEQIIAYEERIFELTGAEVVAVTLDMDGALIFERGSPPYRTYAQPSPNSRAAGAGDTFVSALTLALSAGAQVPTAAEIASAAASVVVEKEGTASCSLDELRQYMNSGEPLVSDLDGLLARLGALRKQGRRVVFTNGCFDILHRGHINYLNRAKQLGDLLVVGLNSDASIRRLKGDNRPINSLEDRAQVLAALSCIDYIVPFEEDTPVRLIEAIRPEIFVKGGDYTRETLPEAPVVEGYGGSVQILAYLEDFSTTHMIERIRRVYALPASNDAAARLSAGGR